MKNGKIIACLAYSVFLGYACYGGEAPVGYTDTPMLPGQKWRVHDPDRPQPRVVTPGERFSEMAAPPSDAVVLFDGKDLSKWIDGKGQPAAWKVENGYMEINGKGSIRTKDEFGDFQLHLEFATPSVVKGNSQERGNSGILIYGRYEVQVLDSYQNRTYADGSLGSLYGQCPPLVNAARKPGEWQTYDIIFEAPRWDESGKLIKPAYVTVILNGVVLHHKKDYLGPSLHRELSKYGRPQPPRGPIMLQDHGNPIRFRNIWIRSLGEYDQQ
ncbi:MAG: 3-keto-disaccharide hydrolase [Verrucomicrobiia bacterium]